MYELSLLLDEYSNKKADISFVDKALFIIFDIYDISDMVREARTFNYYSRGFYAFYNYIAGSLGFNMKIFDVEDDDILLHNAKVLQIILHECHHMLSYKLCQDKCSNNDYMRLIMSRNLLLKEVGPYLDGMRASNEVYTTNKLRSFQKYIYEASEVYIDLGGCHPTERIAEIGSYRDMLKIISCDSSLYNYFNDGFYNKNLVGYCSDDMDDFPFKVFFDRILEIHYDKDYCNNIKEDMLRKSSNMSLKDRLFYGLPITAEEYNGVNEKVLTLR